MRFVIKVEDLDTGEPIAVYWDSRYKKWYSTPFDATKHQTVPASDYIVQIAKWGRYGEPG